LVASAAAPLGGAIRPAGGTCIGRAARGAGRSAIERLHFGVTRDGHQGRSEDNPGCVSH
jgi:hypothetical protein